MRKQSTKQSAIDEIIKRQEEEEAEIKKIIGNDQTGKVLKIIVEFVKTKKAFSKSSIMDIISINEAHLHRTLDRLVRLDILTKEKYKNVNHYTINADKLALWIGKEWLKS